ncbi:Centromere/kinetochore protein zw10, partial [Rhizoclosmatium hyalinum]
MSVSRLKHWWNKLIKLLKKLLGWIVTETLGNVTSGVNWFVLTEFIQKLILVQRRQRDQLKSFVAGANGLSNLTDDVKFETVEKCIKQALSHLNTLSRVWKPLLAAELYLKSMGLLANSFIGAVMDEVDKVSSMRKDECHQLRYILRLVLKVENCFEKKGQTGKDVEK